LRRVNAGQDFGAILEEKLDALRKDLWCGKFEKLEEEAEYHHMLAIEKHGVSTFLHGLHTAFSTTSCGIILKRYSTKILT
jgi:hypothetical protein